MKFMEFNKSIKESEEYKNLELEWLSMPENIKQQGNNERTRVLVKR